MSRSTSPTIALVPASASVRSGEPDCPYFLVFLQNRASEYRRTGLRPTSAVHRRLLVTLRSRSFACGMRSRRPRRGFFSIRCTSVPTCVSGHTLARTFDRFPSVSSLKRSKLSSSPVSSPSLSNTPRVRLPASFAPLRTSSRILFALVLVWLRTPFPVDCLQIVARGTPR